MDKRVTSRITSSPAEPDSSGASIKHDSFLEDMELFSHESKIYMTSKEVEQRNVTRRTLSPVVVPFATVLEQQDGSFEREKGSRNSTYEKVSALRKSHRRETSSNDKIPSGDGDSEAGTAAKETKVKIQETKAKSRDNKFKSRPSEPKVSESQSRTQNEPSKLQQERKPLVKDRGRRSGSAKESNQSAEASKENKQPLNSCKQANSSQETSKEHSRRSDGLKKLDSREIPESVALLSAVKEVVSTYTKEEGMKVLRTLNELHILSQASLIKNLMFATDEIRKDLQLGENLGQLKFLMAENERLRENFSLLKIKNEDLQRRVDESESIKEENARLKLRLQEIAGRKSS